MRRSCIRRVIDMTIAPTAILPRHQRNKIAIDIQARLLAGKLLAEQRGPPAEPQWRGSCLNDSLPLLDPKRAAAPARIVPARRPKVSRRPHRQPPAPWRGAHRCGYRRSKFLYVRSRAYSVATDPKSSTISEAINACSSPWTFSAMLHAIIVHRSFDGPGCKMEAAGRSRGRSACGGDWRA